MFRTSEQQALAERIASALIERGETVAVAESTTGGLVSASLLAVAGASKYYLGGGVLYTLTSRVALAGVPASEYEGYRGTTPELLRSLAEATRLRLGATWCVAESGLAGPGGSRFGAPAGHTTIGVVGPIEAVQVFETGLSDRAANMVEFTTLTLRFFLDALDRASTPNGAGEPS